MKKFLSIVLSVLMLVTCMCTTAFAAETDATETQNVFGMTLVETPNESGIEPRKTITGDWEVSVKQLSSVWFRDHTEDFSCFSNRLAANGKSTRDSRFYGARGCSLLDGAK